MSFIRTIKTGQGVLGWDDATYRSVLIRLTGKNSAKSLTPIEAEKVIKYMRSVGFKKSHVKPKAQKGTSRMLSKIEAILADLKLPWHYAENISQRMFNGKKIAALADHEMHSLLKAFIYHQNRKNPE